MTNCVDCLAPSSGQTEPVYDRTAFLARLDGDEELARELIELFLEDYPETLATLAAAIETGNAAQLRLAAHSLRGTVANFSAHTAQESAHRLEQMGRSGVLAGAPDVYAALVEALAQLRSALVGLSARLAS